MQTYSGWDFDFMIKLKLLNKYLKILTCLSAATIMTVATVSCNSSMGPQDEQNDMDEIIDDRVVWLQEHALRVDSVSPDHEDFTDLQPLKEMVGNARVIMLGEQSHGDGTTFLAKARLIKFLHQEMDFDVIAFESGLYNCRKAWEFMRDGEDPLAAFRRGVFGIWSLSAQVEPLADYLGEAVAAGRPLELAGFDSQFGTSASSDFFVSDLETFLNEIGATTTDRDDWHAFKETLQEFVTVQFRPDSHTQTLFFQVLDVLQPEVETLTSQSSSVSELFWVQMMKSLRLQAEYAWSLDPFHPEKSPMEIQNMRDEQMGRNLIWLANTYYSNRKIIVWAATFHIARYLAAQSMSPDSDQQSSGPSLVTMGDVVHRALGYESYVLGFTAYQGKAGNLSSPPRVILPSRDGDLEGLMNSAGLEYAIVDFRRPPPSGNWLRQRIVARPLGYVRKEAHWTRVLDGMMYTRRMTPSTRSLR